MSTNPYMLAIVIYSKQCLTGYVASTVQDWRRLRGGLDGAGALDGQGFTVSREYGQKGSGPKLSSVKLVSRQGFWTQAVTCGL